jgi:hypothetical protein
MPIGERPRPPSGGRRPRRTAAALLTLSALLATAGLSPAAAGASAAPSVDGSTALIGVRSAAVQVTGTLSVSIRGHYYESADLVETLSCDPGRYVGLHLAATYGVSPWLEAGLELPFRRASWRCDDGRSLTAEGVDNPSLLVKLGAPGSLGPVRLAALARIGIAADDLSVDRGGAAGATYLTGGRRPDHEVALLASADLTEWFPLRVHLNVGRAFHREDDRGRRFYPSYYPNAKPGAPTGNDAIILRGAVEFPGRSVDLFTEFRGDMIDDRGLVAPKENALILAPGVRLRFAAGWTATVGFGVGISGNDRSTDPFDPHDAFPDWEASLAVQYAWPVLAADSDGDGIPDFRDLCPTAAEDFDRHEDEDGCPDPDNDGDLIPDEIDLDPELPEDFDGFEDADGVPDLDNDSDGIVDERDMCPDRAEDLDGFEDEDGCPDG